MHLSNRKGNKGKLLALLGVLILVAGGLIGYWVLNTGSQQSRSAFEEYTTTAEAERTLTEIHRKESADTIEQFQSVIGSFAANKDPNILAKFATGPYLQTLLDATELLRGESSWIVTSRAEVRGIRVLEYSPNRFKAIGCGFIYIDRVTSEGQLIRSLPVQEFRNVFVFVNENGTWKATATLSIIDRSNFDRDWQYVPDWMKDELGDVPSLIDKDCLS